jgi:hypothetical protein
VPPCCPSLSLVISSSADQTGSGTRRINLQAASGAIQPFPVLACSLSRALSQGVVLEAVDSDGWVTVQWASGSQNKYRYRQGAYDVQLLGSGMRATVATDAATATAAGRHSGEWRDQSTKGYHCSVPGMVEGALCSHGGGILQVTRL